MRKEIWCHRKPAEVSGIKDVSSQEKVVLGQQRDLAPLFKAQLVEIE